AQARRRASDERLRREPVDTAVVLQATDAALDQRIGKPRRRAEAIERHHPAVVVDGNGRLRETERTLAVRGLAPPAHGARAKVGAARPAVEIARARTIGEHDVTLRVDRDR